jgi:hypothetical protein
MGELTSANITVDTVSAGDCERLNYTNHYLIEYIGMVVCQEVFPPIFSLMRRSQAAVA